MRMVIWKGLSALDGKTPIVLIATDDSRNTKTGDMVQTWILRDDMSPLDAIKAGADQAICGTCPHRSIASGGSDACYVQVWAAPQSIWKAYKRDGTRKNAKLDSRPFDLTAFAGRKIRFGSYGDPAAVPLHVWQQLASVAQGQTTGYTHQWKTSDQGFAKFLMASCDSAAEWKQAKAKGYRSFVVRAAGTPKPKGLVSCPASVEAGKKTSCASCLQCSGTGAGKRADITIMAHGAMAGRFASLPLSVA